MSKVIADVLDIDALRFKHLIEEWEARAGHSGHDLKLYSDMRIRARQAMLDLGLDPSDTISGELYFALQERAKRDNDWLSDCLKIKPSMTSAEVVDAIIEWISGQLKSSECWSIKPAVMRQYLVKQPPKAVMKLLGLRSVDSMLKRNQPAEILSLARLIETKDWNEKFNKQFKKLTASDFASKNITLVVLDSKRYEKVSPHGQASVLIRSVPELGSIAVGVPAYRFPLDVLALMLSITEEIAINRRYSAFYRAVSMRKEFSQYLVKAADEGLTAASLTISDIGWNSLHKHLVGNEYFLQKIEQPHLTADDLSAESALDILVGLDERFKYWKNLEFSFYVQPGISPVSLNLVDVVTNAANRNSFGLGHRTYGKMKLWEELWARYLSSDTVAEDIIGSYVGGEN